jgi:integrase
MAKFAFSDLALKNLSSAKALSDFQDLRSPGFGIRVTNKGTKTFFLRYRYKGKLQRLTIGPYPTIKLADARGTADAARTLLRAGKNPKVLSYSFARVHPALHPINNPAGAEAAGTGATMFEDAVEHFLTTNPILRNNKPATAAEKARVLRKFWGPHFNGRTLNSIKRTEISNATEQHVIRTGQRVAANQAHKIIKLFFKWCVEKEYIEYSPAALLSKPATTTPRQRVLNEQEIVLVWRAATRHGYPYGIVTQVALLTMQRRGEISKMRWNEINWRESHWTIPGSKAKNGRPTVVPLSTLAVHLLRQVHQMRVLTRVEVEQTLGIKPNRQHALFHNVYSPYVFPARANPANPISGFSDGKERIDAHAAEIAAEHGLPPLDHWTIHDLRRTATTLLGKLNTPAHLKPLLLNHTNRSVTAIYDLFDYLPDKAAAVQKWADYIEQILASPDILPPPLSGTIRGP